MFHRTYLLLSTILFIFASKVFPQQRETIREAIDMIDSVLYDCARDSKWANLQNGFYDNYPMSFNMHCNLLKIADSAIYYLLDEYAIEDTFKSNIYYLLNMCTVNDSTDVIVVRSIYDPSNVDICRGFFIYKSSCFFVQSGFNEFFISTEVSKDFTVNKYPQIYVDEKLNEDYYVYNGSGFYRYFPDYQYEE